MKQRKLIIGLLVILAVAVSGFTFAFWASSITGDSDIATNTIQVGEGDEVTTTIALNTEVSSGLDLVPVGREVASESVSTITYTFDVEWAGASSAADAAGATGTLNITPVLSGAGASELALFTVTAASTQDVTYGSTTEVIITVTFTTEPANAAQYALIANAELTLTVTFLVDSVSVA